MPDILSDLNNLGAEELCWQCGRKLIKLICILKAIQVLESKQIIVMIYTVEKNSA